MGHASRLVTISREISDSYDAYVRSTEEEPVTSKLPFMWSDGCPKRTAELRKGRTALVRIEGKRQSAVPGGMIHDWVGAVLIEGATISKTLALLQDYDNHKSVYRPDVIESKVLSRDGDDFEIYLRLLKKKAITVVLDTWHRVHYGMVDEIRAVCRSRTTRICEIEHAGGPGEMACLPDTGHGFLWRLYSQWKFEERGSGVVVECRVISLTRDVPAALAWIIAPMVQKLPAESLRSTLESTRRALAS